MEPARVNSAVDAQLVRTLARMALQILDQELNAPSSESLSRGSPEPKGAQETSRDNSHAKPDGDGGADRGTTRRSPTDAPLALGSTDDVHPA
jgi:hypothetical protein